MGWCLTRSFFVQLFPRATCTFVLVHTSFAFSVRRPPTFTTCPMRSVSRVSLLLACRECNCCPTNRHHAYIVLSASWSSHTHTLSILLFRRLSTRFIVLLRHYIRAASTFPSSDLVYTSKVVCPKRQNDDEDDDDDEGMSTLDEDAFHPPLDP